LPNEWKHSKNKLAELRDFFKMCSVKLGLKDEKNYSMKIVIKVGTQAILANDGTLQHSVLANLVHQIASLKKSGEHIVLVSSGAVGSGRRIARASLGREYGHSTVEKQLLASLGQPELIHEYAQLFKKYGLLSSQLLLTKQDFYTRQHYLNIAGLLRETFLHSHIVPIVNENDSVAIEELMFTDNDELAGLIAAQLNADKLIILSSVKGIYNGHPDDPQSEIISEINPNDKIDSVSPTKTAQGRGGMVSKISTARKMSTIGVMTHIAHVNEENVILRLVKNERIGTTILPLVKKSNIKRWLAFNFQEPRGRITINACLTDILLEEKRVVSIMPVGIDGFKGEFQKGDVVDLMTPKSVKIGVGIAKYNSDRLKEVLGQKQKPVFIHYDHLHIFD
jgi:glutamate 5-kinase